MDRSPDESTSLLPASGPATPPEHAQPPAHQSYRRVLVLCAAMSLVADLGGSLVDTPEVRLLELSVCRDYYRIHDPSVIGSPPLSYVDEKLCKLDEIQSSLADLRATKALLMALPGLLLSLFYGRLADRIGRKPVLLLGLTGQVLALLWMLLVCYFHNVFPTKAVLAMAAFQTVGGGVRVVSAMLNSIVVDVSPEHLKTTVFYLIGAAVLITDIIAVPIGSWLLSRDIWLPFKFSVPIILLSYPILVALPETLSSTTRGSDCETQGSQEEPNRPSYSTRLLRTSLRQIKDFARCFTQNRNISFILATIFLVAFSRQADTVFLQFTSKLLDWPLSTAGYLLSVKAFVILAILIGLATITQLTTNRSPTQSLRVDLLVARVSAGLLTIGSVFMGMASSAGLFVSGTIIRSAGLGIIQAMQGTLASFIDSSHTGEIYSAAAVLELAAAMIGNLSFAALFKAGLGHGVSRRLGLPYLVSGALFSLVLLLVSLLPFKE